MNSYSFKQFAELPRWAQENILELEELNFHRVVTKACVAPGGEVEAIGLTAVREPRNHGAEAIEWGGVENRPSRCEDQP